MKYPAQLLYYFQHRNHGGRLDLTDPTVQYVQAGNQQNGEMVKLYVRYQNHRVETAKFQAASSVALIAAAEFICVWLEKKTYQDLALLTHQSILQELGLTELNIHIANLIIIAVKQLDFIKHSI